MGVFALLAVAADPTGTWKAQVPGRGGQARETTFTLKAQGGALTGTVATQRGQQEITEGKVSGDDISFVVVSNFGGNQAKMLYKGKVSADEIKFTVQREGGEGQAREFVAKKSAT
jgi:hypothetical protein